MKTTILALIATVSLTAAGSVEARDARAQTDGKRSGDRGDGERSGSDRSSVDRSAATGGRRDAMSAAQQQNVQKLQGDLAAIKSGSQVTPAQKQALTASLQNMATGATKPSQQSVEQLSTDLSKALSDGNISAKDQAQLSKDLGVVMNSANIPQSEVQQASESAQAILKASGVSKTDVQQIGTDLKAISTTAQAK